MAALTITNRRKPKSRKKWIKISAQMSNGETWDLAQFTHVGDAQLYLAQLQAPTVSTIEEIFVD